MDIKNLPKTEKDFELLNKICMSVVEETIHEKDKDWTEDDINLFVSQFNNAYEEDPIVDESVINMLWECENKKLEDARIAPLRINNQSIKLTDNLSNLTYIEDGEAESISKTASPTNCKSDSGRTTQEKEKKEKEEWDEEVVV